MELNQIIHGDSYEILPTLPDKSFDAVIIDPPYGMGIDKWDKHVDVAFFTEQIKRIGKEFYAVFGVMPYLDEWHDEAKRQGFHFLEHISWVKRDGTPAKRLYRNHEDIYIYAIAKRRTFYTNTGKYEDVKVPGVLVDVISLEAIQRYISDLRGQINGTTNGRFFRTKSCGHETYKRLYSSEYTRSIEFANFTNVWSFLPPKRYDKSHNKSHCTVKPTTVIMRLAEMLTAGDGRVLDCFSGSGTTAIACQRLNRQFLCIEKEQEFYEYSLERLNGDVWQPELDINMN